MMRLKGHTGGNKMAAIFVRFETPKELADKIYKAVELARDTGKIRKGSNEVTKIVERGEAAFVVMAEDVSPPEILAHMPLLCEEKSVPYGYVPEKLNLGLSAGIKKGTASIAITEPGKAAELLKEISAEIEKLRK